MGEKSTVEMGRETEAAVRNGEQRVPSKIGEL